MNMFLACLKQAVLVSYLAFTAQAWATDIQFNGYGTVAAGKTLGDGDEFLADAISRGSYDNELRFDQESMVAIRATAAVNERLDATLQISAKGAESNDALMELAFVAFQLNPTNVMHAGKFRLPLFYYSEFLDTGFAYHWIRPPTETYNIRADTVTGVDLVNTSYFGALGLTTQLWYGAEKTESKDIAADITKSQGISLMAEYKIFRLRALYHTASLELEFNPTTIMASKSRYWGLAFMADWKQLLWRSEYSNLNISTADEDESRAYASIGYSLGNFIPHYTYSVSRSVENYTSHTAGVRWDFAPNSALKLEYTNQDYESKGGITLFGFQPPGAHRIDLISMALDFVF